MSAKSQYERIIFGLKVKQLRQQKGLSFAELGEATGMSLSYLNEIEKGKKYPKEDKILMLAQALGTDPHFLSSAEPSEGLAPVAELLKSNFLNELPLDLFGIELAKVVEIIADAPAKVGAFISTLLELSRSHAVREENFYFGALRSYLQLHNNYFESLEDAVDQFTTRHHFPLDRPIPVSGLKKLLEEQFGYAIVENGLDPYPELHELRSVFLPDKKKLLLNSSLNPMQKAFQLGKELGFQVLGIKERANTSSLLRGRTFEEVLNHSRAIYFSVALHIPKALFIKDLEDFFAREKWEADTFLNIMRKYEASPEMFYHRMTNILPRFFGMRKLFFLRVVHDPESDAFEIDKELYLNHRHQPHGNALLEHYCRRWVSISLLKDLNRMQREGKSADTLVGAQRSQYIGSEDEYLCLTMARPSYPAPNRNVSVTLGLLIQPALREKIRFLEDPAIQIRQVDTTCERCPVDPCVERAAPPVIIEKRERLHQIQNQLNELNSA